MKGLGLRNLLGNVATTLSRHLFSGLLQLVIIAIVARFYGPEGNGSLTVALLLSSMLTSFLNLGIAPANVYFIGAGKVSVNTAWRSTIKLFFIISVLGLIIGASTIYWFSEQLFPGVQQELLWVALYVFPVSLLLGFVSSVFQGLQQFKVFNLVFLIQPIISLVIITILVVTENSDLVWLLGAYIISATITLILSIYLLQSFLRQKEDCEIKNNYLQIALNYGYKAHLSNILAFINYKADIILVNFFLGPASTGIYVIAVQLAERLWLLSQSVSTVLLPRLSQLEKDENKRKKITPLISRWVFFATLLGSIILASLVYPIIKFVFGVDYLDAITPLLVLLPGIIASSGARILANDLAARGRPEFNLYTSLITVVINVIGNIVLIPEYGINGAAAATSICYSVNLILKLFIYWRHTGIVWQQTIFIRKSDLIVLKSFFLHKG
jgi:O-antigen/teichoic acid export membrane protein